LAWPISEQETETDATLGDAAIVVLLRFNFLSCFFGVFLVARFVGPAAARSARIQRRPSVGNREIVTTASTSRELTLHLGAGQTGGFELATDQTAKLVDAFKAELLGEIVVGDEFTRNLHPLDGDVEVAALPLSCSAG
jgi:hypothetical protein